MKILFILRGVWYDSSGKPVVSGGDVITVEIARRWARFADIHFLTSGAGRDLCKMMGLVADYHELLRFKQSDLAGGLRQSLRLLADSGHLRSYENTRFDLVCSSCEHLSEVLPALYLKKRAIAESWMAIVHFVVPSPSQRLKAGRLRSILYYLNHRLGAVLIRTGADLVVAVSKKTASEYVTKVGLDQNRVVPIPGGLDLDLIRRTANPVPEKEYDAIFMKRLHPMKGVFEVLEVWRDVVRGRPNAKLLIVGGGTSEVIRKMEDAIGRFGLWHNVVMKGSIYDQEEKIRLLAKSRIFLLPSFEENWALVIGEALATGLPVIAYDLPEIRPIWGEHVVWIPKGDKTSFSTATSKILSEGTRAEFCRPPAFLRQYDWNFIADLVWRRCEQLISQS